MFKQNGAFVFHSVVKCFRHRNGTMPAARASERNHKPPLALLYKLRNHKIQHVFYHIQLPANICIGKNKSANLFIPAGFAAQLFNVERVCGVAHIEDKIRIFRNSAFEAET